MKNQVLQTSLRIKQLHKPIFPEIADFSKLVLSQKNSTLIHLNRRNKLVEESIFPIKIQIKL